MKSLAWLVTGAALGAGGAIAVVRRPAPPAERKSPETVERGVACDSLSYLETAKAVEKFRVQRRLSAAEFARLAKEPGTVVLDARGEAYFRSMHVKGAVNLPYTDFSEPALKKAIPDGSSRVLIYCRNNFADSPVKASHAPNEASDHPVASGGSKIEIIREFVYPEEFEPPEIPKDFGAGLNIPTFVTLWVYGYQNVYELNDVVDPAECPIEFEGTAVK